MKRGLLLLFPIVLATCTRNNDVLPDNPVIGRWELVARQDSTGTWQPLLFPLEPGSPTIEFQRDFSVDYIKFSGEPERGCCQPTHYSFVKPGICPPNASCLKTAGTIQFDAWVTCANAYCAAVQSWTTISVDDKYLDIYALPVTHSSVAFRYRRI